MSKVFVEDCNYLISRMFLEEGFKVTTSFEHADLICFEGGADVTPSLYGEENDCSYNSEHKDFSSLVLYNNAKHLGIPMVGICRGGQFLNVMGGGKMFQDYPGHAIRGTHPITFVGGWKGFSEREVEVTSTHHQVMIPNPKKQTLLAWGDTKEEAEIVYNDWDSSLSFQPHPEYVKKGHPCRVLFFDLIQHFYSEEA